MFLDGRVIWQSFKPEPEYEKMPLCIEVTKMGTAQYASVFFSFTGTDWTKPEFEYSYDNVSWTKYNSELHLNSSRPKVYFRATAAGNERLALSTSEYTEISINQGNGMYELGCRVKAYGNIMSLYTQDFLNASQMPTYAFYELFHTYLDGQTYPGTRTLEDASNLVLPPYVSSYCYRNMFNGQFNLKKAPKLPATKMSSYCYSSMFNGCTSLIEAPELPATTTSSYCYESMFNNCTSLTKAPSKIQAATMSMYCSRNMFYGCTSLTKAPELQATKLNYGCYRSMFNGCTSLNEIKVSFTTWTSSTTNSWMTNVSPTGTFHCNPGLAPKRGVNYIPEGWTIMND